MGEENRPKSAWELAMERLAGEGIEDHPLSDEQKARIAEVRRVFSSRLAEREILFHDSLRKTADAATRDRLEEEMRVDRGRLERDRDRDIERIRKGEA